MLKCWRCNGSGATNVNSDGWGLRCDSCGGTGNAGLIQMLLMFGCAVFGCFIAPIGTMTALAEAKAFGYVPPWLAWPLSIGVLVLWYLFFFLAGIWKQFRTAAGLGFLWLIAQVVVLSKTQAPRPIVSPTPVVATSPAQGSDAVGQNQPAVAQPIRITIHAQLGPIQTAEEVTLRIDATTKQWKLKDLVRSQDIVVELPAPGNYNYQLTSTTSVNIRGKSGILVGRGEGVIQVQNGTKFVYVIHDAQGVAPLRCELRQVP